MPRDLVEVAGPVMLVRFIDEIVSLPWAGVSLLSLTGLPELTSLSNSQEYDSKGGDIIMERIHQKHAGPATNRYLCFIPPGLLDFTHLDAISGKRTGEVGMM